MCQNNCTCCSAICVWLLWPMQLAAGIATLILSRPLSYNARHAPSPVVLFCTDVLHSRRSGLRPRRHLAIRAPFVSVDPRATRAARTAAQRPNCPPSEIPHSRPEHPPLTGSVEKTWKWSKCDEVGYMNQVV